MKHDLKTLLDVNQERLHTAAHNLKGVNFDRWKVARIREAISRTSDIYSGHGAMMLNYRNEAMKFFNMNIDECEDETKIR